jgi:hypothetical protein
MLFINVNKKILELNQATSKFFKGVSDIFMDDSHSIVLTLSIL